MKDLTVGDLMNKDVITLQRDETLHLVEQTMQLGRVRHLPVVDGDKLVGLVTHRDLLRAQVSALAELSRAERRQIENSISVESIMRSETLTATPGTDALEAAKLMQERRIGCLPVVEDEVLVGIVTEADFLALLIRVLEPR